MPLFMLSSSLFGSLLYIVDKQILGEVGSAASGVAWVIDARKDCNFADRMMHDAR